MGASEHVKRLGGGGLGHAHGLLPKPLGDRPADPSCPWGVSTPCEQEPVRRMESWGAQTVCWGACTSRA